MARRARPRSASATTRATSDRDSEDKDREETKRLLYVALTRARDRLYLSGTAPGGKLVLQRGSLGRILPAGLMTAAVAGADPEFAWQGPFDRAPDSPGSGLRRGAPQLAAAAFHAGKTGRPRTI